MISFTLYAARVIGSSNPIVRLISKTLRTYQLWEAISVSEKKKSVVAATKKQHNTELNYYGIDRTDRTVAVTRIRLFSTIYLRDLSL